MEEDLDLERHAPIGEDDAVDLSGAVSGITSNKRRIRTGPSANVSEFSINTNEKVKLHELMGTLTSTTSAGDLKKQLRNVYKKQKVLSTPLSRFEQNSLSRSVAYEQTSKEVSKWEPIVEKNRKAEQLEFPLERPSMKVHTGRELAKKIQPYTPLEKEIAVLLHGSDNVLPEKSGLTKAEQRALSAMDINEARERRAELQKYRALLSYKEARAKRQKKIKSKQFHRILNKERRKQEEKSLDNLEEKDPELLKEKIDKAEKSRIQERMSLKHHGGSKKMRTKMIYAKYDQGARLQITDMLQKSRDLKQKAALESDSEEETPVQVVEEAPKTFSPWTGSGLVGQSNNPWLKASSVKPSAYFRPAAIVPEKNETDDDVTDVNGSNDVEADVRSFNDVSERKSENVETYVIGEDSIETDAVSITKPKPISNPVTDTRETEDEEDVDQERNEVDDIFESVEKKENPKKKKKSNKRNDASRENKKKAKVQTESTKESEKGGKEQKQKKNAKKKKNQKNSGDKHKEEDEVNCDESGLTVSTERKRTLQDMDQLAEESARDSLVTSRPKRSKKSRDDTNIYSSIEPGDIVITKQLHIEAPTIVENENDDDITQKELIAEAFADDDVIDAFAKEKAEVVDRDKPKAIDLSLPGWGSWGGTDIAISKRKRRKFTIKAPELVRKDRSLKNVIISETKDNSVAKHQVSWLPRSYKNVHQFESSIRAPLGRDWNPETSFRDLNKPKVITHLGTVIAPMDESQKFRKQKQLQGGPEIKKNK